MDAQVSSGESTPSTPSSDAAEITSRKILHALEVFPFISASMIHMAIGTSTPTVLWRPVLEGLVKEGKVAETTHTAKNSTDRQQVYTIYHLPQNNYSNFQA